MEQAIGVICACLPVMPQLFKKIFRMKGSNDLDRFNIRSDPSDPASNTRKLANIFPLARRHHHGTDDSGVKTDYDADIYGFARIEDGELVVPRRVTTVEEGTGSRKPSSAGMPTTAPGGPRSGGSENLHLPKGVVKRGLSYEIFDKV